MESPQSGEVVDAVAKEVTAPPVVPETEDVEARLPAKNTRDFRVEFLQAEQRKLMKGSTNVGAYVVAASFYQKSVAELPLRKKKRKPSQEEMPWIIDLTLVDDPNNEVQDFLTSIKEGDEEFRVRVSGLDAAGNPLEAFILKEVTVIQYPNRFDFSIEVDQDRLLQVRLQASDCIRKSKATTEG